VLRPADQLQERLGSFAGGAGLAGWMSAFMQVAPSQQLQLSEAEHMCRQRNDWGSRYRPCVFLQLRR